MIAKTLFLAKGLSAMRMRIFRDHEILARGYPGGYPCGVAVRLFPDPASPSPAQGAVDAADGRGRIGCENARCAGLVSRPDPRGTRVRRGGRRAERAAMNQYVFDQGWEKERDRLAGIEFLSDSHSTQRLAALGVRRLALPGGRIRGGRHRAVAGRAGG